MYGCGGHLGHVTNFEGDKITFERSYDKQDLTLVVISYEIYQTSLIKLAKGLLDKFHMECNLLDTSPQGYGQ